MILIGGWILMALLARRKIAPSAGSPGAREHSSGHGG
jgi:hypothetical protein